MKQKTQIDITNGPLASNLILFALPVILTSLSGVLVSMGDNLIVGHMC